MGTIQVWTIAAVFGSFAILIIKVFIVLHYLPKLQEPNYLNIKPIEDKNHSIVNFGIGIWDTLVIIINFIKSILYLFKVVFSALTNPNFVKSLLDLISDIVLSLGVGFLATVLGGQNQIMGLVGALLSLFISALLTISRTIKSLTN